MLHGVSDEQLQGNLKELVVTGDRTEARIVAHLAELETRRLHLLGGRSLFAYCMVSLELSESQAYYRICAARAAQRFPIVFELLERREIHLTALSLIGKHLTPENHCELLAEASGKTKQQILELIVRRWPKADVSSQFRKLPRGAVAVGPTATLEPLSPDRHRLQLLVTGALMEKIELACDLMSHSNPERDLSLATERAFDSLIRELQRERFGHGSARKRKPRNVVAPLAEDATAEPRAASAPTHFGQTGADAPAASIGVTPSPGRKRKHIPNAVRREVTARDGMKCTYVGPDGACCAERAFLQIDHIVPWARGGDESVANLRLLCRAHNRLSAERAFGSALMSRAIAHRRQ